MSKRKTIIPGLHPVEILHVDTAASRTLYSTHRASPSDKYDCQKLLRDLFRQCCETHGGLLRDWAGDGGFAFFLSSESVGSAIKAAEMFLKYLPVLNGQTALRLEAMAFYRSVRIKAHRGEVYISDDGSLDSADPKDFDDFLKAEKIFAPKTDELFITGELHDRLAVKDKNAFELYRKRMKAGSISTPLFRLKKIPQPTSEDIFKHGDELSQINQSEWTYLRTQIFSNKANVATRNLITKGLILAMEGIQNENQRSWICEKQLLELTLTALYNYLRAIFEQNRFRVSYWRAVEQRGRCYMVRHSYRYPENEECHVKKRKVKLADQQYQVCRAFKLLTPVATPSVVGARNEGSWTDFDNEQKTFRRDLASALQFPVYYVDADGKRKPVGVLTLDSDKPDMFLVEEISMWQDDLVGFLVNLALAERLRMARGGK